MSLQLVLGIKTSFIFPVIIRNCFHLKKWYFLWAWKKLKYLLFDEILSLDVLVSFGYFLRAHAFPTFLGLY